MFAVLVTAIQVVGTVLPCSAASPMPRSSVRDYERKITIEQVGSTTILRPTMGTVIGDDDIAFAVAHREAMRQVNEQAEPLRIVGFRRIANFVHAVLTDRPGAPTHRSATHQGEGDRETSARFPPDSTTAVRRFAK